MILGPTSSVVPIIGQPIAEHRTYLSLAAVVILVVLAVYTLLGRRCVPVFAALAVGLGILTVRRNEDYRSEVSIWRDTIAKCPDSVRAHYNLGVILQRTRKLPEAIGEYERAIQINPNHADAHCNLGYTFYQTGRLPEAIAEYEQALRIEPDSAVAHENLGNALARLGRATEAIEQYQRGLRVNPNYAEARYNLGNASGASAGQRKPLGSMNRCCGSNRTTRRPTITWDLPCRTWAR